jgi:hypothetical protein
VLTILLLFKDPPRVLLLPGSFSVIVNPTIFESQTSDSQPVPPSVSLVVSVQSFSRPHSCSN